MISDEALITDDHNLEQMRRTAVRSFVTWLRVGMETGAYNKSDMQKLKSVFTDTLEGMIALESPCPVVISRDPQFIELLSADARTDTAKMLVELIGTMERDSLEMRLADQVFSFSEINPGIGAFGLAALNVGGISYGSRAVAPMAQATFKANRGSDSLMDPNTPVDINLVNLPFSAFVGIGQADPAVVRLVEEAAAHRKKTRCTLFRVDWTLGHRLGISEQGYRTLIGRHFPGHSLMSHTVDIEWFVPMEGHEFFVLVGPEFNSHFSVIGTDLVTKLASSFVDRTIPGGLLLSGVPANARKFPRQHAGRIDADYWHEPSAAIVQTKSGYRRLTISEVKALLGINPEFKVPSHEPTAYHLLGESVVVPVAERAIRGVLRALR